MKKIEIIIATRNRYKKLLRMIRSIPLKAENVPLVLRIICDADPESRSKLIETFGLDVELTDERKGAVFCRNFLIAKSEDAILYATDDIVFQRGAIESAIRSMRKLFPDDDGVIGFNQEGNGGDRFSKSGVALVGHKFLVRYPEKKLFYPKYHHFACQEIERGAMILNRFFFDRNALVYHYHPSFNQKELDETHVEAREFRNHDRSLSNKRRSAKLTWGING